MSVTPAQTDEEKKSVPRRVPSMSKSMARVVVVEVLDIVKRIIHVKYTRDINSDDMTMKRANKKSIAKGQ